MVTIFIYTMKIAFSPMFCRLWERNTEQGNQVFTDFELEVIRFCPSVQKRIDIYKPSKQKVRLCQPTAVLQTS